jgi:hypothetical protein
VAGTRANGSPSEVPVAPTVAVVVSDAVDVPQSSKNPRRRGRRRCLNLKEKEEGKRGVRSAGEARCSTSLIEKIAVYCTYFGWKTSGIVLYCIIVSYYCIVSCVGLKN